MKTAANIPADLEAKRARIAKLKDERASLINRFVPQEEANRRIDESINALAEQFSANLVLYFAHRNPAGQKITFAGGDTSAFSVLAWLSPAELKAKIKARIATLYAGTKGIAQEDLDSQLDAIDAEILQIEIAEERHIVEAERQNVFIRRRPDADPRALIEVC